MKTLRGWVILGLVLLSCTLHAREKILVRVKLNTLITSELSLDGTGIEIQNKKSPFQKIALMVRESILISWLPRQNLWSIRQGSLEKEKKSPFLYIEGEELSLNGSRVPGKIFLWPKPQASGQSLDVIAILELDEYLKGVIPSEMPLGWPLEALKAQTILARSYVLSQMEKNKSRYYHVESSVLDQKYSFPHVLSQDQQKKLQTALQETSFLILKNKNLQPVKALYHADCGGETEQASNVWGGGKHAVDSIVRDEGCPAGVHAQWNYSLSLKTFAKKISLSDLPSNIQIFKTTPSGRIASLKIQTAQGERIVTPQFLRSVLGYSNLKSALFEVSMEKDQISFKGRGFGHGVGLCQNGAKNLALMNKNYKEILKHYFPQYTLGSL